MDVARFAELFAVEADQHIRLLNRGILGLESADAAAALEQAFRSVHTIKGMAATMGYARVTTLAHTLEDTLDPLRAGSRSIDSSAVDELLAAADQLEMAVAETYSLGASFRGDRRAVSRPGVGEEALTDEAWRTVATGRAPDREPAEVRPAALSPAFAGAGVGGQHLRIERTRFDEVADRIGELVVLHARVDSGVVGRIGVLLAELQRTVTAMRMVPLTEVFDRLPRAVRDVARALGKDVELEIEGGETEVDRAIAEELRDPLLHLLRNAVGHGIEQPDERERAGKPARGRLGVRVTRERGSVRIDVSDDGRGIALDCVARPRMTGPSLDAGEAAPLGPQEMLDLISRPGFSTAESVTQVSGRGVGMDAVVSRVRALGGAIDLATEPGLGTTFTLHLPITLAVAPALRVRVGGEDYAIPLTHIREAIDLNGAELAGVAGRESVRVRDELIPLIRLRHVFQSRGVGCECAALVAELGGRAAALAVDELVAREQILVKTFDSPATSLPVFSGATLLAGGQPALILDPASLL